MKLALMIIRQRDLQQRFRLNVSSHSQVQLPQESETDSQMNCNSGFAQISFHKEKLYLGQMDDARVFDLLSLLETCSVILIYLGVAIYVLIKVKWRLELTAYMTIFAFLSCELINFTVYLMKVLHTITGPLILVPFILSQFGLYSILVYYTYQIKVVIINIKYQICFFSLNGKYFIITSDCYDEYSERLKRARIMWGVLFLMFVASYTMEIVEKFIINEPQNERPDMGRHTGLSVTNRVFSLITEFPLILIQWKYLVKIIGLIEKLLVVFQLENFANYRLRSRPIDGKGKLMIIGLITVLAINTLNSLTYNLTQILLRFGNPSEAYLRSERAWIAFSEFFYDILILINGVAFLLLFKSMGLLQQEKREIIVDQEINVKLWNELQEEKKLETFPNVRESTMGKDNNPSYFVTDKHASTQKDIDGSGVFKNLQNTTSNHQSKVSINHQNDSHRNSSDDSDEEHDSLSMELSYQSGNNQFQTYILYQTGHKNMDSFVKQEKKKAQSDNITGSQQLQHRLL